MMEWWWLVFLFIALLIAAGGAAFGVGRWVAHVNSDREDFRGFMAEIRENIKEILRRLPPASVKER